LILDTIEKPEEPRLFGVIPDIIPVDVGGDTAKNFPLFRAGEVILHICMLEKRIFPGVEEALPLENEVGDIILRLRIQI
jgi:hypothetical protein